MRYVLTIEADPVPASRPKVTRTGVAFYPARHVEYKTFLKRVFEDHEIKTEGPLSVRLLFVEAPPKSKVVKYPTSQSDVDNLAKLPLDSMTTAGFWMDDRLIVSLVALKRYCREGETPHTKVLIEEVNGDAADYVDTLFYLVIPNE